MKINFACGKQTWDGWFCIDAVQHAKATRPLDLVYAAEFDSEGALIDRIPLPDGCADEVHGYHCIEHVFAWEASALVAEWKRMLKPGGLLVIECPNIALAAKNLIAGERESLWFFPFYGDPSHRDPYMCHKNGFTTASLSRLIADAGFMSIEFKAPKTHGGLGNRDMRLEARKP